MTPQEMLDQVSDELRNTKITSKILRWLNLGITEISSLYVFGTFHKYGTKNTAIGIPDVTLDADFLWLKSIQNPGTNRRLYPEDEERLSQTYPTYRTLQGTVTHYYLNGTTLGLWAVPSSIFPITYSYQKRPAVILSDLSVTCDLPLEWHAVACQKAITYGYDYDGDAEGSAKSVAKEKRLIKAMGSSVYRRPDETLVLGGPGVSRRPPYPQLPPSYPRYGR